METNVLVIKHCHSFVDSSFFHPWHVLDTWQHQHPRSISVHCACECRVCVSIPTSASQWGYRATLRTGQTRLWATGAQIMRVTHKFNIQYSCTKWIYEDKHCYSLFIALQIFMILNFCYIMSKFWVQLRTFLNSLSSCKILKCYHKLSKSLRSVNHSYQETFYRQLLKSI